MNDTKITSRSHCPMCGKPIWYPRETAGRPHVLDLDPVPDGPYVVVAWNARIQGLPTAFIGTYDPAHDEDEERYRDHRCQEGLA